MLIGLAVAAAAVAGALGRVLAGSLLNPRWEWPVGTLAVNVAGSFALGLLAATTPTTVTIAGVGFLGSLTTFSTVTAEVDRLRQDAGIAGAAGYLAVTLAACIGSAWLGLRLA